MIDIQSFLISWCQSTALEDLRVWLQAGWRSRTEVIKLFYSMKNTILREVYPFLTWSLVIETQLGGAGQQFGTKLVEVEETKNGRNFNHQEHGLFDHGTSTIHADMAFALAFPCFSNVLLPTVRPCWFILLTMAACCQEQSKATGGNRDGSKVLQGCFVPYWGGHGIQFVVGPASAPLQDMAIWWLTVPRWVTQDRRNINGEHALRY